MTALLGLNSPSSSVEVVRADQDGRTVLTRAARKRQSELLGKMCPSCYNSPLQMLGWTRLSYSGLPCTSGSGEVVRALLGRCSSSGSRGCCPNGSDGPGRAARMTLSGPLGWTRPSWANDRIRKISSERRIGHCPSGTNGLIRVVRMPLSELDWSRCSIARAARMTLSELDWL